MAGENSKKNPVRLVVPGIDWYILVNDVHEIQLRSEIVAVHGRMNMVLDYHNGQMIPGDEHGLHFLIFVLQLRKNSTRKLTQPGIEPGLGGWEATMLPLRALYTGRCIVRFFVSSWNRQKNRMCGGKSDRIFCRDDRSGIWTDSTRLIACDSSVVINCFVCSVIVRFFIIF